MKPILTVLLLITLFSCGKKNDPKPPAKTRYDLLINKKWKLSAESGYTVAGVYVPDAYTGLEPWAKDDYIYFYDNLTYEQNEGPLKESPSDPQITDHGTWELTTDDQFIKLVSDSAGRVAEAIKILELTDTKLSVEETLAFTGNKVTDTFTAIH